MVCWGYNEDGELGIGSLENIGISPQQMGSNLTLVDFGTGIYVRDCFGNVKGQ